MTTDEAVPRWSRRRVWLGAILLLLVAALALAWFARRDLAGRYADDILASRGVPARYTIADLGPGGQRLTDVVIGDPQRPDLTADWIETDTRLGLSGPYVTAIRAGRVRLRGRVVDGRISLGALDRLLPAPNGQPISLPDLALSVADGRMRLETPAGAVGAKLTGQGNLRDGFRGTLAAVAPTLATGGCRASGVTAFWQVAMTDAAPRATGPLRVAEGVCGDWRAQAAVADVAMDFGPALDRIDGQAKLALAQLRSPRVWLTGLGGTIAAQGPPTAPAGTLALRGGASAAYGASATTVRLDGRFRLGTQAGFAGTLGAEHASLPAGWRSRLAGVRSVGAGTPAGPLLDRLGAALVLGGRDAAVRADLSVASGVAGWRAQIAALESTSASGTRVALAGGDGLTVGVGGVRLDGTVTLGGGGLPDGRVALAQSAPGAPVTGTATFAPYRAGSAALALTPVTFRASPAGNTVFATRATLSGPLGDGRVEEATLALNGGWDGAGRLVLNPRCEAAGFRRLSIAGLTLDPARFALCPAGRALVTLEHGRLGGGARIVAPRLSGRLGASPITLAARGSELRFRDGGLGIEGLAVRLGEGPTPTRLDIASLTGRIAGGGIAGHYTGAGGRIGAVPLLLSDAAGNWRLANGVLKLDGALTVADAAAVPRFKPVAARDVALTLANGRIDATGVLAEPAHGTRLADVVIRHRLSDASGTADLTVPGIVFGPTLQPGDLTRLTLGVIADVHGSVHGAGHIAWSPRGVTSTGDFATDGVDLAAAFGPVTGLKGTIHFTDLLALESAPGQVATVASINPGVAVEGGTIRYQLRAGPMVRVEDARWPFAGGTLTLEPALLDYSRDVAKRLTFRIDGLDAAIFLQRFDYKNLTATGVFDGTLPMVFDATGGRIDGGRLKTRGGGTLAYVGEVSQENLGTWGNLAFDALKSLRYRELDLTLNGPLAGEIVTTARFGGVAQGEGAKSNFLIRRLAKLPFVFNVKITAPFRSLLDTARSFYDPNLLVQRNLPALIEEQKRAVQPAGQPPVQPAASGPVPKEKQD